jgi:serine/threonine-protein kinase
MQGDIESYARDERVAVSPIELREWMQTLFADKLAQQKDSLQDLKELADVIAAQSLTDTDAYDALENSTGHTGHSMYPSAPGASRTVSMEASSRGLKTLVAVLVVLAMVAVAAVGFLFVRNNQASTALSDVSTGSVSAPIKAATAAYGAIEIVSTPPGAAIWINGELRAERTPAMVDKLPRNAPIDVKLTMDGYAAARQAVTLTDEQPKQTIRHELTKGTVTLVVETNVAGAKVFIDKKSYDELRVEGLSAGEEHKVVVAASGYLARTARFTAGPNETKTLSLAMEKETEANKGTPPGGKGAEPAAVEAAGPGKLNVGSRGGYCNVSVRGQAYGPTPVGGIALPAGAYVVVCKPESGAAQSMSVTIQPGKTARVSFQL